MAMIGGGDGCARWCQWLLWRASEWCSRERATSSRVVLCEVADRFSNLGVGLSGPDGVGTARGKHEECRGMVR